MDSFVYKENQWSGWPSYLLKVPASRTGPRSKRTHHELCECCLSHFANKPLCFGVKKKCFSLQPWLFHQALSIRSLCFIPSGFQVFPCRNPAAWQTLLLLQLLRTSFRSRRFLHECGMQWAMCRCVQVALCTGPSLWELVWLRRQYTHYPGLWESKEEENTNKRTGGTLTGISFSFSKW